MARLPSYQYLVQDIGGRAVLFEDMTERELASFEASDEGQALAAQRLIALLSELSDEDRCFAHFWSGYLHAHASGMRHEQADMGALVLRPGAPGTAGAADMVLEQPGDPVAVVVSYLASDGDQTARAQKVIHDSELPGDARMLAHFWSGYFWARNGAVQG